MAARTFSFKRLLLEFVLPFLALAAICFLNSLIIQKVFSVSRRSYLDWYISTGPFIGLALAAFGAAWKELDKNIGLVSANPRTYIIACSKLAGLPMFALGGHFKNTTGMNLWDIVASIPLITMFIVASFAWLVLIAPLQYFLFLVCAAPSRIVLRSKYRLRAHIEDQILYYSELRPETPEPTAGWDASMRGKPVTMANAFGALVLVLIGYLQVL
ncbi:MAG TPA: hypothetical protein VFH15_12895 [Pyrinomonadaceae bacterium]|nr:hypothetical protein [Pyrinomonadaceae bacterium]